MGLEVAIDSLTKSFGGQTVWRDLTLTLPKGEISVMLGPSGTGKTVFLKSLVGLVRPERGRVMVDGVDMVNSRDRDIYRVRREFGLMFQDGALFGSLSLFDNVAFPLREHTKKRESEIRRAVMERLDMVGLAGAERKLPGEISGGMRKRVGLARALVMDPQVILCDEPDSGLDPVRTSHLSQLLIDLNATTDATMLIVTHNIDIARTVPDNLGMLYRGELVAYAAREVMLTSREPVIEQFLNGRTIGPIGMTEENDAATWADPVPNPRYPAPELPPQLEPSPGLPRRQAEVRRRDRLITTFGKLPREYTPRGYQSGRGGGAAGGPGDQNTATAEAGNGAGW